MAGPDLSTQKNPFGEAYDPPTEPPSPRVARISRIIDAAMRDFPADSFLPLLPIRAKYEFLAEARIVEFRRGMRISGFGPGLPRRVQVILTGWVSHETVHPEGTTYTLRGPGDVLGDDFMAEHTQSGTALSSVSTVGMAEPVFTRAYLLNNAISHVLLETVVGRLQRTDRQRAQAQKGGIADVIDTFLQDVLTRWPNADAEGYPRIVNMSQADIGRFLGISRASVENHVRDLKEKGIVQVGNRSMTFIDPGYLAGPEGAALDQNDPGSLDA